MAASLQRGAIPKAHMAGLSKWPALTAIGTAKGRGKTMFNAKDTTILLYAATALLFLSFGVIASGDLLIGGFTMFVASYFAIVATLPGENDNAEGSE